MRKHAPEHHELATFAASGLAAKVAETRAALAVELGRLDAIAAAVRRANAADPEAAASLAEDLRAAGREIALLGVALGRGADTFECLATGEVWRSEPAREAPPPGPEEIVATRLLDHACRSGDTATTFDAPGLGRLMVGRDPSGIYDVGTQRNPLFWGSRRLIVAAIAALLRRTGEGA
jgi:hypothetical protein